jgi:hypothetical protein
MLKIPPFPAEPCHGMQDYAHKCSKDCNRPCHLKGKWVQRISVIRDGEKVWFQKVIGPASDYERVQPLLMPSFGENTVAEMQYWGEKNRNDTYWADRAEQMLGESTLIQDHINQLEQTTMVRKNRSVFGPHQSTQRTGYPVKAGVKEKHGRG